MRRAALLFTVVLCAMLSNRVAGAFDCTGVSLPSSIVICSDPELMRLADECESASNRDPTLKCRKLLKQLTN
jgi:uncharacterized protein